MRLQPDIILYQHFHTPHIYPFENLRIKQSLAVESNLSYISEKNNTVAFMVEEAALKIGQYADEEFGPTVSGFWFLAFCHLAFTPRNT